MKKWGSWEVEKLFGLDLPGTAVVTDDGREVSYTELKRMTDEWAAKVPQRSLVFLLVGNNLDSLVAYVACLNHGIVPLMLDAHIDGQLLRRFIEIYRPDFIWRPDGDGYVWEDDISPTNEFLAGNYKTPSNITIKEWKTGTTDEGRDGWFVGFTRYYTTGIWVGNDTPEATEDLMGATYPGHIWQDFMNTIHEGLVPADFPEYKGRENNTFITGSKKEEKESETETETETEKKEKETKATETKAAETKAPETSPPETTPPETTPPETFPPETTPPETTPPETAPPETSPPSEPPADPEPEPQG